MSVPFRLSRGGAFFDAVYSIDGSHLTVQSVYGSRRAVLGIMKPKKLARGLFQAILRDAVSIVPPVAAAAALEIRTSRAEARLPH